ncbi:MAG: Ig domain-containing protein [Lachnospiraceae bacterium]
MKRLMKVTAVMCSIGLTVLTAVPAVSVPVKAATAMRLNKSKVSLTTGQTVQLKLSPKAKKVTWKSSNKKVAVVTKKGKVTAYKRGKVTITARADGKNYTCRVQVSYKKAKGFDQTDVSDQTTEYKDENLSMTVPVGYDISDMKVAGQTFYVLSKQVGEDEKADASLIMLAYSDLEELAQELQDMSVQEYMDYAADIVILSMKNTDGKLLDLSTGVIEYDGQEIGVLEYALSMSGQKAKQANYVKFVDGYQIMASATISQVKDGNEEEIVKACQDIITTVTLNIQDK